MKINAYLQCGGRAAEAIAFYQAHLGATAIEAMPFRSTPGTVMIPDEWQDKLLHFSLQIGDSVLMGSDGMPDSPVGPMQGCALALSVDSTVQAERVFAALAEDGMVTIALAPSFFAARFGMVVDRFGVSWMVIHNTPA